MDLPPQPARFTDLLRVYLEEIIGTKIGHDPIAVYDQKRARLNTVLEDHGFRYFRGGRVIPNDMVRSDDPILNTRTQDMTGQPTSIEELLQRLLRWLPRAMYPLKYRRKGSTSLLFESEYDIQDLLHSQLRPWVFDIRPGLGPVYRTPSRYAPTSAAAEPSSSSTQASHRRTPKRCLPMAPQPVQLNGRSALQGRRTRRQAHPRRGCG